MCDNAINIAFKRRLAIIARMDTKITPQRAKPQSANEFLTLLENGQSDFGKGGRRLARFFMSNLHDTALLTSAEVAQRCEVHASSVVRLAQGFGFSGYRELQLLLQRDLSASLAQSRSKFEASVPAARPASALRIHILGESGQSFNEAARRAAERFCAQNDWASIKSGFTLPDSVEPQKYAKQIEAAADEADGLILVAREHPAINGAVRSVVARGVPVICLTSDLPSSTRTAYVGSDQYASGATAAWLCGRMLSGEKSGKVLFVYSVPFRCQLDREQGFRQVLRAEFPALTIDEKVSSHENIDVIYDAVRRYIKNFGPPTAIYNVSGANSGIGHALEDEGVGDRTIFIGHELNDNSRSLLERGTMDLAIGHDFDGEMSMAVDSIRMALQGQQPVSHLTQSQLFTRYNYAIA
jgi:LacI family transcriptional regulator